MPGKLKITGSNLTPRDPIDVKSYCAGRQAAKDGKAAPTAGTAKTGVIASNNAIAWTANMVGQGIVVNLFNPGADNPAIAVSVNWLQINIALATNSGGAIFPSATAVMAAVAANPRAAQMVSTANDGASTGAGVVTAQTKPLAGSTMPQSAGSSVSEAFMAGRTSWTADPAGVGRDVCALPYGGGHA